MTDQVSNKTSVDYSGMPSILGPELSKIWKRLYDTAGNNPRGTVTVTDKKQFDGIEALGAIGGCKYERSRGKLFVKLVFGG